MAWRIVEVSSQDACERDLTSSELVALSILAAHNSEKGDVYHRAWEKLQPQVEMAINNDDG